MSTVIENIEKAQLRELPRFDAGDRVRVHFQVIEGNRKRTQVFEGIVIKRQGSGARETFTVRKKSFGVGVERVFPVHSPKIEKLEVAARGAVRRAKLYYLRDRIGKAARVAERRWGIEDELVIAAPQEGALDSEGESQEEAEPIAAPETPEGEAAGDGDGEEPAAEAGEAEAAEESPAEEGDGDSSGETAAETAADSGDGEDGGATGGDEPAPDAGEEAPGEDDA